LWDTQAGRLFISPLETHEAQEVNQAVEPLEAVAFQHPLLIM
jgi:hypothetical protein